MLYIPHARTIMGLASTLDGTQTMGMDAAAMFPSTPPTLTTPPYSALEFPLYLKPKSEAFEDVIDAVVRSLRQPPTPLNQAFFSRTNVDALQAALQTRIIETMGMSLGRQSDWEMMLVMRQLYMDGATNWPDSVDEEVARLNTQVVQVAARAVSGNVTRYMSYRTSVVMPAAFPYPADQVTNPAYETGTPAPLPDFNFGFDRQRSEVVTGMPTPVPRELVTPRPLVRP